MKKLSNLCVRFVGLFLLIIVVSACSSNSTAGLEAFQSSNGRYGFFYPTGWTRVAVSGGPEVVFHDVINSDETLSLVVSDLSDAPLLEDIGSPEDVGDRLINDVIAPDGTGREAQLLNTNRREVNGHTFYDIEYSIHLPDRDRHEIATVVIDKGSLFTLAASTNEKRWSNVSNLFEKVITSLTFFYD